MAWEQRETKALSITHAISVEVWEVFGVISIDRNQIHGAPGYGEARWALANILDGEQLRNVLLKAQRGCEFLQRMFVVPPLGGICPQKFRLKRASSLGNWKLAKKMASQGCLFRTTGASEFLSQRANSSLSMFRKRKQSVFVRLRSR